MLGEAALTRADAERYREKYRRGHRRRGPRGAKRAMSISARHSISIKLSALHPRYEIAQRARVHGRAVSGASSRWCAWARDAGIGVTLDAEEADRLELSLVLVDRLLASEVTRGYAGFGLAVQAYQKRASATHRVVELARCAKPTGASRCGWSRVRTGTAKSSAHRNAGSPATRCITRKAEHRRVVPGLRACCFETAGRALSIRSSPRTTRTPSPMCWASPASRNGPSSSSGCTAWARTSTTALCARREANVAMPRVRAGGLA